MAPLRNPPIVEALIDLHVSSPISQPQLNKLDTAFYAVVRDKYPKRDQRRHLHVEVLENGKTRQTTTVLSKLYRSTDDLQVVQARVGGFTFSRLTPYESWEPMRDEARRLWALFCKVAPNTRVNSAAVRYVNRFMLPVPMRDISDYLLTAPVVAPKLPQLINESLVRIVLHFEAEGATAVITQATDPANYRDGLVAILFDIHVVARLGEVNHEDVWNKLEALRAVKNRVFFESITDRLRSMYE